jgi:glucan phosphoethanolaminetransferase (alkaline phosphatase superfamily)
MENNTPLEALPDITAKNDYARYPREAGLRILLLALIFLTGNFFIPQREYLIPFNITLAAALFFNLVVITLNLKYSHKPAVPVVALTGNLHSWQCFAFHGRRGKSA